METLLLGQGMRLRVEAKRYRGNHFTGGAGKAPRWTRLIPALDELHGHL